MNAQPGQSVVFLLTDIEESTQVWNRNRETMLWALARHDTLLRHAIEENRGSVFKDVGDGFYAVFGDARDAVAAALDAQRALIGEVWGMTNSLSVRMAVHAGPVLSATQDFYGAQLSRTTRLLNMAHGGQVLVAGALYDALRDRLPAGSRLRDLGEFQLHELGKPERIYQLAAASLPYDFPPLQTGGGRTLLRVRPRKRNWSAASVRWLPCSGRSCAPIQGL